MTGVPETSSPRSTPVALPAFTQLPDLASRALAGSVGAASDELFAQRENQIRPEPSVFSPHEFGHKGKVYDGWETRRRRDLADNEEPDWAIVRLGVPGVVHGVVVDTAWFTGNYPPFVSVEGLHVEGYPPASELADQEWAPLVAKSPAFGDTANTYAVEDRRVWTHLRLSIYPDGGVARLRVHGRPTPDPRFLTGTIDLAAMENGGRLVGCSDAFYSSPANLILPGRAQIMGHGWENARRRGGGNDFAVFALAGEGRIEHVELDTSYFVGNAPGWMRVQACRAEGGAELESLEAQEWWDVVPHQATLPDTRHRFLVDSDRPASHVRLDVYPDGGLARMRVHGRLTDDGLAAVRAAAAAS
jgi:allantoicase